MKKFIDWYVDQITKVMDESQELESIDLPLKLSIVNPLHAKWPIEIYNKMTSTEGRQVCLEGQQVVGINNAVEQGLSKLPCFDTFEDIDPLLGGNSELQTVDSCGISEASKYVNEHRNERGTDEDCNQWVEEHEQHNRNIFDKFDVKIFDFVSRYFYQKQI